MTPTPAAKAFLIFSGLVVGAALITLGILLVGYGKTSQTTENTGDTKELARQIAAVAARIEDCSSEGGKCYQENQKRTGAAIQTLLESFHQQINPHRLRNEAENLCQIFIFAGPNPHARGELQYVMDLYQQCVLTRSGGTEPPPVPPNPYTTTTTTTTGKKGQIP